MTIETERESDGRWNADIPAIPGVMAYGDSREEAIANVEALALRVNSELAEERADFFAVAIHSLAGAYGANEPEYTAADFIKE